MPGKSIKNQAAKDVSGKIDIDCNEYPGFLVDKKAILRPGPTVHSRLCKISFWSTGARHILDRTFSY